jgi:hypothetical protein
VSGESPHRKRKELTKEQWEELLSWLDPDRDKAGERYESLRRRLIKLLMSRGSPIPEDLADESINIVAAKLNQIRSEYSGNPESYFLGVARKVLLESQRRIPSHRLTPLPGTGPEDLERKHACLDECLNQFEPTSKTLLLSYYAEHRQARIDHRKQLAERFKLAPNALRIKTCRLREALRKCVEACWQKFADAAG